MDLALEMGCTKRELGARMTERELHDWRRYIEQRGLPQQRIEYLLARILMILDLAHMKKPGTEVDLADYLPGAKPKSKVERASRALEGAFGGAGIVLKRRKRGR